MFVCTHYNDVVKKQKNNDVANHAHYNDNTDQVTCKCQDSIMKKTFSLSLVII